MENKALDILKKINLDKVANEGLKKNIELAIARNSKDYSAIKSEENKKELAAMMVKEVEIANHLYALAEKTSPASVAGKVVVTRKETKKEEPKKAPVEKKPEPKKATVVTAKQEPKKPEPKKVVVTAKSKPEPKPEPKKVVVKAKPMPVKKEVESKKKIIVVKTKPAEKKTISVAVKPTDELSNVRNILEDANYTVITKKTAKAVIKHKEPRQDRVIVKEKVDAVFTTIQKDIPKVKENGKEIENKAVIKATDSLKKIFARILLSIDKLATHGEAGKIEKVVAYLSKMTAIKFEGGGVGGELPYSKRFFDIIQTDVKSGVVIRHLKNLNTYKAESEYFKLVNSYPVRSGNQNVKMVEVTKFEGGGGVEGNVIYVDAETDEMPERIEYVYNEYPQKKVFDSDGYLKYSYMVIKYNNNIYVISNSIGELKSDMSNLDMSIDQDLDSYGDEFAKGGGVEKKNPVDTITVDVPLFIRMLEYAKEDAKTDMDLHSVTENAIKLSDKGVLGMSDYENIVGNAKKKSIGKVYYEMHGIGRAKYTVNFHDGVSTHDDGSPFFDIKIFKNKKDLQDFIDKLEKEGYVNKYEGGGYTAPITPTSREFRYLRLTKYPNKLKVELTEEGREKAEEDGLDFQNFFDYFDDIQGNSEYLFHDDGGAAGFGMTEAPVISDGYYFDEDGKLVPNVDSDVYYYNNYMITDFAEVLREKGEVEFDKAPEFGKGGSVDADTEHFDKLYHKAGNNVYGAIELYAGELGVFNMFYGHKVDSAKKAKVRKMQNYLENKYLAKGGGVGSEIIEINKYMKALKEKAKKSGIYEDFGQKEVRLLEDKYGYTSNVAAFDNWVMNFDISQL